MTLWRDRVAARLDGIRRTDRWRSIRTLDGPMPTADLDGRPVVSFASNDYLGLAAHPEVAAAAREATARWGTGSGASRLVVGGRPIHDELEAELAGWKGTEAALLLPTGFAANLAVLSTLADAPDVLVVSDELNHASIIDGARLARGQVAVARHGDARHVAELLGAHAGPALVVTDTVFSMDGDEAPVAELAETCRRHDALLVLDEAHAVLGPSFEGHDVVRVGTLSKTLGSLGGFVAAERDVIDLLTNSARPFIFTTAPTPGDTAAALAALRIVRSSEGEELIQRLRGHVEAVAPGHPSPIIPVVLGEEAAALDASARLLEQGLLVPAIRPPTVAPGTSRLRVALSAAHTDEQVERLVKALSPWLAPGLASLATPSASASRRRGEASRLRPAVPRRP
jgi:8-amino-7-oxononanoate synthase